MLKVKLLNKDAILPTVAHRGDLGYDVYCCKDTVLQPKIPTKVPTGIAAQFYLPFSGEYGLLVRDRSSMAGKGLFVTGGVLDSGYLGEISVMITDIMSRGEPYVVKAGDKIAQLLPLKVHTGSGVVQVDSFDQTDRGDKGFGSSGEKCNER